THLADQIRRLEGSLESDPSVRERSVVTKHIRNAFQEGELNPAGTSAKFAQIRTEGDRTVSREVDHYNLEVIISVGYRVKSLRGTQFRIWATRTPRDHLLRGYMLNERRQRERACARSNRRSVAWRVRWRCV